MAGNPLQTRLEARWRHDVAGFQAAPSLTAKLFEGIASAYSAPTRHYHTLAHIEDIFEKLDGLEDRISEPLRVHFAGWYHDLVYDATRTDNEERSAERAAQALSEMQAPAEFIERVARLVLATKLHGTAEGDADDLLFLDTDYSILGSDETAYDQYAEQVRAEYAHIPQSAFDAGRAQFLKNALKQKRIFRTDHYESRYGQQARSNMERELSRLKAA